MKKNNLFFVALVVCIAFSGCAKREIKNIASRGKTIVCFGNSLTAGSGAGPGEDYPARLAEYSNLPVINAGLGQDTSSGALKRIETDALNRDPLLVIVELGGNDFLKKIPQEITISNINQIVDKITSRGAMVAIVDISPGVVLTEYRQAFAKIAREKSVIFLPNVLYAIMTDPRLKSDYLHPNREGYKLIAQRIYRGIIPYIKKNEVLKKSGKK
jgi:acyl-CoA thioesterase-1